MRKSIGQLIQALDKTNEVYREVLELSEKKQDVVIKGDIKELEKITVKEQGLVASIIKLEDIREQILQYVMKDLGIKNVESLDDILPLLTQEEKAGVEGTTRSLKNLITDVQDVNSSNEKLLQQSLEIVQFNMNMMTSAGKDEPNYGKKGKVNYDDDKSNLFDVKV